jgi:hypothetical protein
MTPPLSSQAPGALEARALPGQAVYTPGNLKLYDLFVLGLSNSLLWRCPTARLRALYDNHLSANHLDVGVASGYFLDRCRFPSAAPRLVLADLNEGCLAYAAARVARYHPATVRANVLAPLPLEGPPFESISMTYLLHCLPGRMAEKAVAFDHLKAWLAPGGVLFGAAILGRGVPHNAAGRALTAVYNRKGIFGNGADRPDELRQALEARFARVEFELVGCVALFVARTPAT